MYTVAYHFLARTVNINTVRSNMVSLDTITTAATTTAITTTKDAEDNEWEEEQLRRKQLIRKMCQKYKIKDAVKNRKFLYEPLHKLLYCRHAKVNRMLFMNSTIPIFIIPSLGGRGMIPPPQYIFNLVSTNFSTFYGGII